MVIKRQHNIDILIMSDNGLETVGGEQESTKIIINGVKDYYKIGIIQPGSIKQPEHGVHYYRMTKQTRIKHLIKNPFAFIIYIWKVKKIINREKPKIIHTQSQVSFFIIGLLQKLKVISSDIQFIHTERGLYTKYSNIIKKIFLFFMKELNVLVTTTRFNMNYWKEAVTKKGLSIDFKIIENTAGKLFEHYDGKYEKEYGDRLVIGFAGRYASWKNWPLAVEISKKLNEKLGEKLRIYMALGCLDHQAENETKRMFKELNQLLGSRFIGKINIDIEDMDKLYYELDVFILTSNHNTESFGRTLVEAMSRKTVVLTTDAGGSVEVVGNKKNVCNTAGEFVERILEFYYDREMMMMEKKGNLNRVKENYSLKNNIDKHLLLYNNLK